MHRPVKQSHKLPVTYVSPELLAMIEIESEAMGGVSLATRALWEQHLRARGYNLGDTDKAERYQRRVAELRAEIGPRQPAKAAVACE
jgi:hypothetical protein